MATKPAKPKHVAECHGVKVPDSPMLNPTRIDRINGARYEGQEIAGALEVVREGDSLHPHSCSVHPPHGALIRRGWSSVTVNRARVGHEGAIVTCPSGVVDTGRPSVWVGGGERLRLR